MTDTDNDETSLLKFPCEFSIKAMGLQTDNIEIQVLQIVRQHTSNIHENAVKTRPSKNQKYISVTVTLQATSKAQLDAIYQDLTDCKAILMAL